MKIQLVSDLHLEFSDIDIPNNAGADVLVLCGDIMVAKVLEKNIDFSVDPSYEKLEKRFRAFIDRCSNNFHNVIWVAGNHEYYHGGWHATAKILKEESFRRPNIYFLERDFKTINGVTFLGCTLWADFNRNNPLTMHHAKNAYNDFRLIKNDMDGNRLINTDDVYMRHLEHVDWLSRSVKYFDNLVVCTHMAPSMLSIHEKYRHDYHGNGYYASDLSDMILDNPQIKYWFHGHMHNVFNYKIGETTVACNPRGYEPWEKTDWSMNAVFEIESTQNI